MQTASSFDVASAAVAPNAALDAVQLGEDTRLPQKSSSHMLGTKSKAAGCPARLENRMNEWRIAGEQQRAAEELATLTASAAVIEDAETATRKRKRDEADAKKALCFNYDCFLGRKCEDPSLHFQDWLKEEQDKYCDIDQQWHVEMMSGAPMVSTESTPLASPLPHLWPRPLQLPRQTSLPEKDSDAYGSSWY